MRDVYRNIEARQFSEGEVVFNVGDRAEELYLCMEGEVSILIPNKQMQPLSYLPQFVSEHTKLGALLSPMTNSLGTVEQQLRVPSWSEVTAVVAGEGFGEAELIAGTNRKVKAVVKSK
jgi:CRP-like cAMP-binding protein